MMQEMELCGSKEVFEDIEEMKDDESAYDILGRAGEAYAVYPWAKAHFNKVCMEADKPAAGAASPPTHTQLGFTAVPARWDVRMLFCACGELCVCGELYMC
jgi:hypothetical protein